MKPCRDERRERSLAVVADLRRRGVEVRELTDDELHWLGDSVTYADIQAVQDMQWIRSARHFAGKLAETTPTYPEVSLFWIRLWGVVAEIGPRHRASLDSAEKHFGEVPDLAVFRLTDQLVCAIESVTRALSEDEVRYAEYRRHVECHPRQSHYRASLRKDGSLGPVRSRVLGDERAQDESEDALRAVILRYGDEEQAAIALAKKVLEPLRRVEAAAKPLCEVPA